MAEHRQHLKIFVTHHKEWIGQVGADLLVKKSHTLDQYLADLVRPGFKFDEIALLCFACMHHKHIFIMMESRFWTTRRDNDVLQCYLKFGYIGNLLFVPNMHESVQCQKFPDGARCVHLFLPKRSSAPQRDRKNAQIAPAIETITINEDTTFPDHKEAKLHSDLRDCVNDVFEAILGHSPSDISNGIMPPAAPENDSEADHPSCTVPNSSIHQVGTNIEHQSGTTLSTVGIDTNIEHQSGTILSTVRIDNNDNAANVPDLSSTEYSTMETDNELGTVTENIDPFGTTTAHTDPFGTGTEQTFPEDSVVGTEPTPLVMEEYTSELNQAVASVQDTEVDTQDINEVLTHHQQPLNEPANNQGSEDLKTGTAWTDDQSAMNKLLQTIQQLILVFLMVPSLQVLYLQMEKT